MTIQSGIRCLRRRTWQSAPSGSRNIAILSDNEMCSPTSRIAYFTSDPTDRSVRVARFFAKQLTVYDDVAPKSSTSKLVEARSVSSDQRSP